MQNWESRLKEWAQTYSIPYRESGLVGSFGNLMIVPGTSGLWAMYSAHDGSFIRGLDRDMPEENSMNDLATKLYRKYGAAVVVVPETDYALLLESGRGYRYFGDNKLPSGLPSVYAKDLTPLFKITKRMDARVNC